MRVYGSTIYYEGSITPRVSRLSVQRGTALSYQVKERTATKSMLASKNTRPAVNTPAQGLHWIGVLAGELNVRLRDAREINPGLWPKTLVLGHRTGTSKISCARADEKGIEAGRSRQIPFPFTRHLSTEYIVKYAKKLWDEVCQPMKNGSGMKLNNVSLNVGENLMIRCHYHSLD